LIKFLLPVGPLSADQDRVQTTESGGSSGRGVRFRAAIGGQYSGGGDTAVIGLLTLPAFDVANRIKGVMEIVFAAAMLECVVCLIAYFTRRTRRSDELEQLKSDMELYRPQ